MRTLVTIGIVAGAMVAGSAAALAKDFPAGFEGLVQKSGTERGKHYSRASIGSKKWVETDYYNSRAKAVAGAWVLRNALCKDGGQFKVYSISKKAFGFRVYAKVKGTAHQLTTKRVTFDTRPAAESAADAGRTKICGS